MQVEMSRRKFLQGSVAMSVAGGTAISATNLFASSDAHDKKLTITTKTGKPRTLNLFQHCVKCV